MESNVNVESLIRRRLGSRTTATQYLVSGRQAPSLRAAMCKDPSTECQEVGRMPVEDEPASSADETESLSSGHSYMSDSSGAGPSDSDAESAAAHRVTPSMLMWHLLRQKGIMPEEHYRELQDNIDAATLNSVAPRILSCSTDSDGDSYAFDVDDDDEGTDDEDSNSYTDYVGSNRSNERTGEEEAAVGKEPDKEDTLEKINAHEEKVIGNFVYTQEELINILGTENISEDTNCSKDKYLNKGMEGDSINTVEDAPRTNTLEISTNESTKSEEKHFEQRSNQENSNIYDMRISKHETETMVSKADDKEIENKSDLALRKGADYTENRSNVIETNKIQSKNETETTKENTINEDLKPTYESGIEGRRTESMENILKEMMNEKLILEDNMAVLETYAPKLDTFYNCNRDRKKFAEPNETLREFALFLNFYSPSAYNYVRETFVTPLPDHKVLSSWYLRDDEAPGLSKRAFDILKSKAAGESLYCTLMTGAVYLTNIGLNYDQVDFGGGCNYGYTDKAVFVFVFMLVGLEGNWKIPVGYIRARFVPAETQAALIRACLARSHAAGARVVAVALDTPAPAELLGCEFADVRNLKTTFKHPECGRDVAVWIDPCLAIRSIRHTLKRNSLIYFHDSKIRYNMVRKLKRLYSNHILNYEDFHEPPHLELRNYIAKVGLSSATLSDSLRPALSLCEEVFPRMFRNSSTTTDFIGAINNLYEILNSKLTLHSGYQRAMDVNSGDVLDILDAAKGYFADIFSDPRNGLSMFDKDNFEDASVDRCFVDGEPVCGFVIYLICIESLKHLHDTLVKTGLVARLAAHRLCKDHVADFVRHMRRNRGVSPEDFTAFDFQSYFTRLLDELETKPRLSDRNVLLEYYPVENERSPASEIKVTSGRRAYDEEYTYRPKRLPKTYLDFRAVKMVRGISAALDTEGDLATRKHMVAYLAGWIAAKFADTLRCEECVDGLLSDKKLWFHKFITLKELNGICLPSERLFRVCWECERVLRGGGSRPQHRVLERLLPRFPWASGAHHPLHDVHLVRAVVAKYIPLRVPSPLPKKAEVRMIQMFGLLRDMHMSEMMARGGVEDSAQPQ